MSIATVPEWHHKSEPRRSTSSLWCLIAIHIHTSRTVISACAVVCCRFTALQTETDITWAYLSSIHNFSQLILFWSLPVGVAKLFGQLLYLRTFCCAFYNAGSDLCISWPSFRCFSYLKDLMGVVCLQLKAHESLACKALTTLTLQ